jgi:hypothetical protein
MTNSKVFWDSTDRLINDSNSMHANAKDKTVKEFNFSYLKESFLKIVCRFKFYVYVKYDHKSSLFLCTDTKKKKKLDGTEWLNNKISTLFYT